MSSDESYNFDDDSISQCTNEPDLNTWRGWKKPVSYYDKKVPLFHTWSAYQNLSSRTPRAGMSYNNNTFPSISYPNNVSIYTSHNGDILYDFTTTPTLTSASNEQQTEITKKNRIESLTELTVRVVASHIPFECVERLYPPVPEPLQMRIAYWSFPQNEDEIRLYACLTNGSGDEFSRGENLFKNKIITEAIQIGFHLSTTITLSTSTKSQRYNVAVSFDRGKITSCTCNCLLPSTHNATSSLYMHQPYFTLGISNINLNNHANNNNSSLTPTSTMIPINHNYSNNINTAHYVNNSILVPGSGWCCHVVALCLFRIYNPQGVTYRAPVSESLSKLHRDQLQKFAQYLISELPQQILPTAQRILDELLVGSRLNELSGAPDPTAGGSLQETPHWFLDESLLHDNIRKTLYKLCIPTPIVFSDVNYLSATAPPAALEWSNLMRPLRGREPEGMWNLLNIVKETLKKRDKNAIRLLKIITEEVLNSDRVITYWYNTKVAEMHGKNILNRNSSTNITVSTQHACLNLCDEIVNLWCICMMNPEASNIERQILCDYLKSQHVILMDKIICMGKPHTHHFNVQAQIPQSIPSSDNQNSYQIPHQVNNNQNNHNTPAYTHSTSATSSSNNFPLRKWDLDNFSGFKPAIRAFSIALHDTPMCYNHSTISENIISEPMIENESNYLDTQHKDLKIIKDENESGVENTYDGSLTLRIETMTIEQHNDKSTLSPSDVIEKKTKCELEIPFVAPSTLLANAEQNIETHSESERVSNNNNYNHTQAYITSQTTTLVNNNNPNLDYFAHLEPITSESENLFYRAQGLYYHGFYTKALPIIYKLAHILLTTKQGTRFDNEQTFFQVGTKGVLGKKIHYQVTKDCLYQFYQTIFLCTVLIEAAEMRVLPCLDATSQHSNDEFDSSVASNETLVEGKNQVFNDIQTHYLLALRLGVNALAHLRPPASSKALEVKLANQESVLWELLSRIAPAFPHLILPHVRRYSLDFVSNAITFNRCSAGKDVCTCNFYSSAHLSNEMFQNDSINMLPFTLNKDHNGNKVIEGHYNRHQTILPHTLATLLFEMLTTYTKEYGHKTMLSSTVVKHCNTKSILTANHDCKDKTKANSTLTKLCKSSLPQNNDDEIIEENLEFRMGLMALELRTAISESDYPLLIEGMRRRRGELALLLITAHKNDCHKLALIMDQFLDPCFHIMCQRPLSCAYFSTARYNTDILTDKAILQHHKCSECIELCSFTSDLTITPDESRELTTPKKVLMEQCPDIDDMDKPSTSSNFKSTFKDDSQTKNISIKADNYTSRLSYDSLVPTEAGAHYAFEFAKTLLIKAGGNVNSDLFLHQNNTSSHYYTQTNHRNQTHTTTTNNNNHRDGLTRSYNINDGTRNHHNSGSSGESPSDSISNEAGGGMYGHLSYSAFCMRNSYYANLNNFNHNNNNTSFNATPIPNNHHGPHKALHFAAFQIGLYALGLHNRCSPNWHSRTYSSHVSWITGQALEIGTSALIFLLSPITFSLTHQQKNENSMDSTTVTLKKSNANNTCKLLSNQNVGNLTPLSNSNNNNNTNYYGGTQAKKYLPEIPALDDDEREVGEFNACLTWHLHLTPSEAASLADKAASSSNIHRDTQLLNKASQLALSCLAKCHALSITETQRALIQCKEQSSSLLKQGCRYVEREARCNYVAPEILFEVARLWYGLFTTTFNNASISSNKIHANHNNTNNNNIALKQPNKVEQNSNVKNLSTTNMVTNSSSNVVNISLPTNVGTSPTILTPNQSMLRSGTPYTNNSGVSNDTEWPIEQTSITNNFNNTNHHTFNQNIANHLVQPPSSMATTLVINHTPQLTLTTLNNLNQINVNQYTSNITNNLNIVYNIQQNFAGGLPYNQLQPHMHINNINNQTVPPPPLPIIPALHNHHQHQFQTFYNNSVGNNAFPPPVLAPNFIFNNQNNSCNVNDNRPQFSLPPQIIPHIYPALIPPPSLPPLPPTYLANPNPSLILPLVRPQLPVISNASIVHIPTPAATINHLVTPTSISAQKNNIHPYTTISQKTNTIPIIPENNAKPKSNFKYIAEDITSEDSIEKPNININSSITKISGYDYLESAFRVGMMALELLGKKILDERSQTKYAPNPTYGEDVKWLSQISLLLGLPFFQQFCSAVHACIASPFILQHIMFDAVDFMRNGFDLYRLLPPPLPSHTNTTSSISNQNSTNSINNNQVYTSSTTLYEMNNENVCSTIISQNSGIISLNKSCNNNQAFTDQDMAHRVANFEAGVLGPLKTKCLQMYSNWVSMRVSHITPEEYDDFVQLLIHAKAAFTLSLPSVDRICTNKNTLIANNSSSIPITQDNTLSKTGTCKSSKISNEGFTNYAGTFKHLVKLQPPSGANNKRNNKHYGQNTIGNKSLSANANVNKNNYVNNNNNTMASTTTKTYNNNFNNNLSPHPPPSIQYVGNNSELNRFHDFLHSIKNTKSFRKELWIKILQNVINYTPAQTENTNYMVPSFNNTTNNALPSIVSSQHPQLPLLPFYIDQQNMSIQYSHNP